MADIELNKVTKVYDDGTVAVKELDLTILDGELVVFVGPSGCGKTTGLRMIAGLEEISGGEISIGGEVVNDLRSKERNIAMVFQNYALYPHMSVFDNLAFGLKMRHIPKAEIKSRVDSAARMLQLNMVLEKKPRALSGGQRQRVAMGRAMVRRPHAFLMDEPLSNLDAKLRVRMRVEIARLQRELGITTVYVTHDQSEAMTLGDRIAVMRNGVLQQVDPPQRLYSRPVNVFVAEFIGSPAMNLVRGALERADEGSVVTFGTHRISLPRSAFAERPGLARYLGREVLVGIRPEDMEDAELAANRDQGAVMSVPIESREDMGAEVLLHADVGGTPVASDEVQAATEGTAGLVLGQDEEAQLRAAPWVIRAARTTRIQPGERATLYLDATQLHFFDPETGEAIYEQASQDGAKANLAATVAVPN